ncbi:putative Multiprotein-bridging factor [Quillaja saponaria]|uniref:Multiprotein-bridging factor n=1 Tax=Quillaja saponaria TaxID=32244 RepID=A0AAD7VMS8_QUISA|nr:putative Multiprotein-bridging factor [Quillaja saponaria]
MREDTNMSWAKVGAFVAKKGAGGLATAAAAVRDGAAASYKTLVRGRAEQRNAIIQARMHKKLTQSQLAQMIHVKLQDIQDYKSGKVRPNQTIIGKLEKALGTKLQLNKK